MKKIIFIFFVMIILSLSVVTSLAADKVETFVDFEKYPLGLVDLKKLYSDDNLWAVENNLYIEEDNGNKLLRAAHYSPTGKSTDNVIARYYLDLKEETIFKFDIQNKNPDTGYLHVQLRADDGAAASTGTNLFYLITIKDNVITYLSEFNDASIAEEISADENSSFIVFLNPQNGEVKIWRNGVLKAHAEPNTKFSGFNFGSTILRFQNYVKETPPDSTSPYITNITYDNICIIQGSDDITNIASALTFDGKTEITELKNGPLKVTVSVINKFQSPKKLSLFLTHKSGGELINLGFDEDLASYGDITKLTATVNIKAAGINDYMELILLDSETLKPIIAPKILYLKNIIETPVADEMAYIYNNNNPSHPRVAAASVDFLKVLKLVKTDSTASKWAESIISEADKIVSADINDVSSPYFLSYSSSLLDTSRKTLSMIETLGIAHKLSGHTQSKYSDKAAVILEAVSAYPDWNPSHFLDTAEMMTAFAFGYDWFYDAFGESTLKTIEAAVLEKGLLVAKAAYDGTGGEQNSGWWKDVDYNWNIVCNSSVAVTASAFADVYPELSFELSSKAVNYVKYALKPFAPHGGAEEGCVYGIYALRYLSKLHTTLLNTYGTDFGMMEHSGLDGIGNYLIAVDGSTGINSYHDTNGGNTHIDTATLLWLGNLYNNPKFSSARMNAIEKYNYKVTPFDLLWYNPGISGADFKELPLDNYFSGTELTSMRSGYGENDIYLSAHGGKANVSHSHIDGGTFVLDMEGFRVAGDIGADLYDADGYFGDKRYDYYRTRAEGHNTLVINPDTTPGQSIDSNLIFEKIGFSSENPFAILDMTDAYKDYGCISAKRGYMLSDNRKTAVIRDELTLNGTNTVYWFMQTPSEVTVSGNTAVFTKNGKTVKAEFITDSSNAVLSVGEAAPLPESNSTVTNYPNSSYKRLQFKITAKDATAITVKFTPVNGDFGAASAVKRLSQWQ